MELKIYDWWNKAGLHMFHATMETKIYPAMDVYRDSKCATLYNMEAVPPLSCAEAASPHITHGGDTTLYNASKQYLSIASVV